MKGSGQTSLNSLMICATTAKPLKPCRGRSSISPQRGIMTNPTTYLSACPSFADGPVHAVPFAPPFFPVCPLQGIFSRSFPTPRVWLTDFALLFFMAHLFALVDAPLLLDTTHNIFLPERMLLPRAGCSMMLLGGCGCSMMLWYTYEGIRFPRVWGYGMRVWFPSPGRKGRTYHEMARASSDLGREMCVFPGEGIA